jgi:predicted RNA binding protein YcfA (HicA-like mRNA interferase family)
MGLSTPMTVCIIHTINSADLIKLLKANGFAVVSVRGSHHKPHPKKDLGKGLAAAILKQAGI